MELEVSADFSKKITLDVEDNPKEIVQLSIHQQKVSDVVIGPYFFENEVDQAITVNGERYYDMITIFYGPNYVVWMWTICGFDKTTLLVL